MILKIIECRKICVEMGNYSCTMDQKFCFFFSSLIETLSNFEISVTYSINDGTFE